MVQLGFPLRELLRDHPRYEQSSPLYSLEKRKNLLLPKCVARGALDRFLVPSSPACITINVLLYILKIKVMVPDAVQYAYQFKLM